MIFALTQPSGFLTKATTWPGLSLTIAYTYGMSLMAAGTSSDTTPRPESCHRPAITVLIFLQRADVDRDGTVAAGELCLYARGQVSRVAREQYGNEQDPLCLPPPGQGAMVRIHPMAKGNNPKPAPAPKAEGKPDLPSNRKLGGVGPGR